MAHLPPVGWADVATKHDLQELEHRLDLRFGAIDHRFDALDARFEARFEAIDHRFEALDYRLNQVDRRFEHVERGIEGLDTRVRAVESAVTQLAVDWRTELVKQSRALVISLATMTLGGVTLAFAAARFGGGP